MGRMSRITSRLARLGYSLGGLCLLAGMVLSLVHSPANAAGLIAPPQQDEQPTETPTNVPACIPPKNWDQTIRLFYSRTASKEWHFEVDEPEMDVSLVFFYYQDYEKNGCPKDCGSVACQSDETGEGDTPLGSFNVSDGQEGASEGREKLRGRLPKGSYTASFHVTGQGSINIGMKVQKDSVPPTDTPVPTVPEPSPTPTEPEATPTGTAPVETPTATPESTTTIVPPQDTPTATPTESAPTPTEPPNRPRKTPTATPISPPATLAPPTPPPGTALPPVLVPVTGGDISTQATASNRQPRLLVNLGIGLLGLGLIFHGFSRKLKDL